MDEAGFIPSNVRLRKKDDGSHRKYDQRLGYNGFRTSSPRYVVEEWLS